MVLDHRGAPTEFVAVDNAPEGFRETIEDLRSARVDPVMQHCKHRKVPILWNQATYLEAGKIAAWEEQAQFGYRAGICLALHMPQGRHFVLGVDRDQELPHDRTELARMMSELQLFAVYAQEAAMRVLVPCRQEDKIPRLTADELDDGRQDGLGSRRHPEIRGKHRATAHRKCRPKASLRECASSSAEDATARTDSLTP